MHAHACALIYLYLCHFIRACDTRKYIYGARTAHSEECENGMCKSEHNMQKRIYHNSGNIYVKRFTRGRSRRYFNFLITGNTLTDKMNLRAIIASNLYSLVARNAFSHIRNPICIWRSIFLPKHIANLRNLNLPISPRCAFIVFIRRRCYQK